jgi:superfamily II DNA or RNA helicase
VFGELSDKWHDFLGLHSQWLQISIKHCHRLSDRAQLVMSLKRSQSLQGDQVLTNIPQAIEVPREMSAYKRSIGILDMLVLSEYSEEEITEAIKKALRTNTVEYRSPEQKRAVEAVVNKESSVVVVLLTGSEKSLTFIDTACLPQADMTIVVALFQTLEKNLIGQCQEKEINCIKWVYREHRYTSVVVVSADQVASGQFIIYASKLNSPEQRLLQRVIIDEYYLTFIASHYRSKLNHLNHLQVLNCLMILLTTTLLLVSVTELIDAIRISNLVII